MTKRIDYTEQEIQSSIFMDFNNLMDILLKFKLLYEVVNGMRKFRDNLDSEISNYELEFLRNDKYLKAFKEKNKIVDIYFLNKEEFRAFYYEERLKDFRPGETKWVTI